MIDIASIPAVLASFALGTLLGAGFYGGLMATLNGIGRSRRPLTRLMASMVLRFGLVLLIFLLLTRFAGWPQLVAAAVGFMAVRPLVLFAARRHADRRTRA